MEPKELHKWFIQNRNEVKILGEVSDGQGRIPVGILEQERVGGVWMLGQAGTGKSQLMRQMALEDIASGRCVIFFDPYGNQIEAITPEILEKDSDRLHYLNAQHIRNVLGLPTKDELKNLIRAQQLLLVDFEVNKLGPEKVSTYGTAILQRIYAAAQDLFSNRKEIYIYIDELQMFQNPILLDLINHSSQLHLNITVANQTISQLDPNIQSTLKESMSNRLWFRSSQESLSWVGENYTKQTTKKIESLKGLQFVLDTELEPGRRVNIPTGPIL